MNDSPALAGIAPARISPAMIALALAALAAPLLLFLGTTRSIVDTWNSSETFAHGYVILPISAWLVWRRRAVFAHIPARPFWPALGLLALLGAGWLVARSAEVQVVMQYAMVAMIPATALALLGPRLARALAFPLLFLLFAVPFGEIFVGPLINFTADFTVAAVRATGIPVLRNGTHFELPTGSWSVVEACSGVRYLISSITLGCLYAYLSYRSLARRSLFIGLSVLVPVIANGLRAYMIVMIGHMSGMALATGVDHIIYGWLFFGLVMFLMFWIGSYWRQDEAMPAAPAQAVAARAPAAPLAAMALAAVAACAVWPAMAAWADKATHNPAPVRLAAPAVTWLAAPSFSTWTPDFMAPDASLRTAFTAPVTDGGGTVGLDLLYYRNQRRDKSLISSINHLGKGEFAQVSNAVRNEQVGGRMLALREARMAGPQGSFLVWHWNVVDGRATANDYAGKLWQAEAKLLMRGDDGAAVILSAPYGENPEAARKVLRAFLRDNLAPIDAALAATRER